MRIIAVWLLLSAISAAALAQSSDGAMFRAEFFNLFNHVNFDNPVSNLNAATLDQNGQITNPGDFGRITSTSNNPRLIQFALKLNF